MPLGPRWGTIDGTLLYQGLGEKGEVFFVSGDLVYWGIQYICKTRPWKWAAVSIEPSLGNADGVSCTGDFDSKRALSKQSVTLSLSLLEGNLEGGLLYWEL